MIVADAPRPFDTVSPPVWRNVGLQNEFATAPLNQRLAYGKDPFGRYLFVEAKKIPQYFIDIQFTQTDHDEAVIIAQSLDAGVFGTGLSKFADFDLTPDVRIREGQRRLSRALEQVMCSTSQSAEFDVVYWENSPAGAFVDTPIQTVAGDRDRVHSRMEQVRADLQVWLAASVDDLAMLLDLSPTTIINLSKPGRNVRPKTVRKMLAVHGLVRELQRVLGEPAALAWTRSAGRRLLSEGRLYEFEQFISTHIFPTTLPGSGGSVYFGSADAELATKEQKPVGRADRL